jgi:hypothetical protein
VSSKPVTDSWPGIDTPRDAATDMPAMAMTSLA